ncbi:TlpA disulfide reductase family protein [Alisedimentitalea sp. MJ-SS2]|uniref:TlpA family protein disulfide reductase n=1 Tax=Aliisedimentitalea sp. MJ-SS2 TaxID=3049795 RepID=UPI00291548CC|nr:TlpA disulfide reductase family protein [Alisedimentitalea sp. MJ-SS2]MDU8927197.1 TlpA disulfide reductase family protein [Alisedimentitalea sp. MJ-SS2]
MRLTRRQILAGLALTASPLRAAGNVPPAASLVRPVDRPRDVSALKIKDEDGNTVSLTDWKGRWRLVNMWSPWCLPCQREMPSLMRLSRALDPAKTLVLPLAFDWRGPVWVRKFYRDEGITGLPVLMGDGENAHAVLGLSNLPSTAVITPLGQLVQTVEGEATWDDPATLAWLGGLSA